MNRLITIVLFLSALLFPFTSANADNTVAQVLIANGDCAVIDGAGGTRTVKRGDRISAGEMLRTGSGALLQIRFIDNAILSLHENSDFRIDSYRYNAKKADDNATLMTLLKGGFRTITGLASKLKPDGYKVKTPVAVIGVRGTDYQALLQGNGLNVAVWKGSITVENNGGTVTLGQAGEFKFAIIPDTDTLPKGSTTPPAPLDGAGGLGDGARNAPSSTIPQLPGRGNVIGIPTDGVGGQ